MPEAIPPATVKAFRSQERGPTVGAARVGGGVGEVVVEFLFSLGAGTLSLLFVGRAPGGSLYDRCVSASGKGDMMPVDSSERRVGRREKELNRQALTLSPAHPR